MVVDVVPVSPKFWASAGEGIENGFLKGAVAVDPLPLSADLRNHFRFFDSLKVDLSIEGKGLDFFGLFCGVHSRADDVKVDVTVEEDGLPERGRQGWSTEGDLDIPDRVFEVQREVSDRFLDLNVSLSELVVRFGNAGIRPWINALLGRPLIIHAGLGRVPLGTHPWRRGSPDRALIVGVVIRSAALAAKILASSFCSCSSSVVVIEHFNKGCNKVVWPPEGWIFGTQSSNPGTEANDGTASGDVPRSFSVLIDDFLERIDVASGEGRRLLRAVLLGAMNFGLGHK